MRIPRRRGLSPIVAELLLVAVTVTIGSSFFFVASSSIGGYANGFSLLFGQNANAAKEIYVVEYAQFTTNGALNVVDVTIRNVGYIEVQVADVGLFSLSGVTTANGGTYPVSSSAPASCPVGSTCILSGGCTISSSIISVPVQNFCTLQVTVGTAWTAGTPYNIIVSTLRGNRLVVQGLA